MHVHNRTSRYHLVIQSAQKIRTRISCGGALAEELIVEYERRSPIMAILRREGVIRRDAGGDLLRALNHQVNRLVRLSHAISNGVVVVPSSR